MLPAVCKGQLKSWAGCQFATAGVYSWHNEHILASPARTQTHAAAAGLAGYVTLKNTIYKSATHGTHCHAGQIDRNSCI